MNIAAASQRHNEHHRPMSDCNGLLNKYPSSSGPLSPRGDEPVNSACADPSLRRRSPSSTGDIHRDDGDTASRETSATATVLFLETRPRSACNTPTRWFSCSLWFKIVNTFLC